MSAISLQEVILREKVNTLDSENSSVSNEISIILNFITGEISVTNELLPGLINSKSLWQFLSSEVYWKTVSSVIREVNLSDLNCIICKEIMPDELKIITCDEELEYFSIIIKELFLRWYSSSTKFLFEELQELWIFFWWNWLTWIDEAVFRAALGFGLWLCAVLYKTNYGSVTDILNIKIKMVAK